MYPKLVDRQRVAVDFPPRPELGRSGGVLCGRVLGWPKPNEHVRVIPDGGTHDSGYVLARWPWITPLEDWTAVIPLPERSGR
jgi:hypothetical protein